LNINTIIFDLGGVLVDWNQRYFYRDVFKTEEEMEWFLENVCTTEWNEDHDAGKSFAENIAERKALFPQYAEQIEAFWTGWPIMLKGQIDSTVQLFDTLKKLNRHKFYALTNWSAETFPVALQRFEFLQWFDGIVVSGTEKTRKPFPDIYELLLKRYSVNRSEAIFIDDNIKNIEAANALGIYSIHFQSTAQLEAELRNLKVL
jgi:2-haloacid dehalogenase